VQQVTDENGNITQTAVANMSLGGGSSSILNLAANSLATVVTLAVAAGNSNANACNYSPAGATGALTVGATTSTDARASYSNYGSCLDLFAPGSSITSAWIDADDDTNTISGTSMATPHVAGVAALLSGPGSTPSSVMTALKNQATLNVVTSAGSGSPNKLLFNGSTDSHPLTATLTKSCSRASCTFTATGRDPDGATSMLFTWTGAISASSTVAATNGAATNTRSKTFSAGSYTVSVEISSAGDTASASVPVTCTKKGSRTTCS
jgi:subtilisin family serine protease